MVVSITSLRGIGLPNLHNVIANSPSEVLSVVDQDNDGLDDSLELALAERFAPIVFHHPSERHFPTNVKLFLSQTELWFYDSRCKVKRTTIEAPLAGSIPRRIQQPCDTSEKEFDSHGTRSKNKDRSFFLKTIDKPARISTDPENWTTYFHSYPNDLGGVTIQYWRFYAYNTGQLFGLTFSIGSHGGDWEAIHVVLDSTNAPTVVRFLGHRDITTKKWSSLVSEGTHVLIESEKGGHTSVAVKEKDKKKLGGLVRQETWTGGKISWPNDSRAVKREGLESSLLVNLGEKLSPFPGMEFLQYSGLWGTRESGWFFARLRSGYWGPAFNETGMGRDNFLSAWCQGMAKSLQERSVTNDSQSVKECYATNISR